jgi:hypothetical protein
MKSIRPKNRTLILAVSFLIPGMSLMAQSEFDIDIALSGGMEYNIFKAPDVLLDRTTRLPIDRDSIIYNDLFVDAEYDIEFRRETKSSIIDIGSDMWYRRYLRQDALNQSRLDAHAAYTRKLTKTLGLGVSYEFDWSNRIGTSVTGDLLMRSFKYIGHKGNTFITWDPSRDLSMAFIGEYDHKDYYEENTRDPLDHGNLDMAYLFSYEFNRKHDFELSANWTNRNYYQYRALDANGDYGAANPLRKFTYYKGSIDYNWRPKRGFRINPQLDYTRRIDQFQQYYSYHAYGGGLRLRYSRDRIYISVFGDYRRVNYDVRQAFTTLANDPLLVYDYIDYQIIFRYEITEQLRFSLNIESDNRDTNTDLEYFKTRRSYNNYQVFAGITYTFPEMKW